MAGSSGWSRFDTVDLMAKEYATVQIQDGVVDIIRSNDTAEASQFAGLVGFHLISFTRSTSSTSWAMFLCKGLLIMDKRAQPRRTIP